METFGVRLRRLRYAAGFETQCALAHAIGVSSPAICLWETDRRMPSHQHLVRIAETLGVSEHYLRYGRDDADTARLKAAIRRAILARKPTSDIMRMCADA